MNTSAAKTRRAVAIMAKQPDPATTKTRLHPVLAPAVAAKLYECFLLDTIDLVSDLDGVEPAVAFHPEDAADYFSSIAPQANLVFQKGEDLGERLDTVLTRLLNEGFDQAAAISSDSPSLPPGEIERAFSLLNDPHVDVVLGPAQDGGYYLIAVDQPPGPLVTDVVMSTPTVLADTVAQADALSLRVALLEPWFDVDEPADLERLRADLLDAPASTPHTAGDERAGDEQAGRPTRTMEFLRTTATPVAAVIPALDEADNIAEVVSRTAAQGVRSVIVVDNGSTDGTGEMAARAGAIVVEEPRRGYGYACAAGVRRAIDDGAEIVAFLDADLSSPPEELAPVLAPVVAGEADLVLGSRVLGEIEKGAMAFHQRFGNALSAALMRRLYRLRVTDLGPFRAIRADLLASLDMQEMTFGWPTEMTVKTARAGATITEVPVSWLRRNAGRSKVSGTLKGSALAARHILGVTIRYSLPWAEAPAPYRPPTGRQANRPTE